MIKAICLTPLLAICLIVSAQKNEKDSLLFILNKSAEDTNKVNLYRKIGASILYQNALEALGYFKQGFILAKKLQFNPGLERCYSAASLAYSINASYDSSLLYNDTAIYYAHKVGNISRLALNYLNRADIYSNLQNYSATIKNCDTALKYAELGGSKDGQARIYSIMVTVYTDQKLYTLALTTLEKVLILFEELKNKQMVGMTYTDQAYIYVLLNDPDKAIPLYKKAIHIADSLKDYENLSGYTGGLAEAYISKNRFAEAESSASSALKYAEQAGNRRQQGVVYEIFYLINKEQNNYAKAIEYDLHAYTIFKEEKDLLREQGVTANLSEAYFKTGNTLEAYNYLKISNELNDSLLKKQFNDETAKLQTTFEVKQKDKEIELLNKNKELQHKNY